MGDGESRTTMWGYLAPLNCAVSMVKTVFFYCVAFTAIFKKLKKKKQGERKQRKEENYKK